MQGGPSMMRGYWANGSTDAKTTYIVHFESPPFTPEQPIIITLTAKSPIKVKGIERKYSP